MAFLAFGLQAATFTAASGDDYDALKREFPALSIPQFAYINMLNVAWQQNGYALAVRSGRLALNWAQILPVMATLVANTIAADDAGSCFEWGGAFNSKSRRPKLWVLKK